MPDRPDATGVELQGRSGADAPQALHGERMQERELAARWDDEKPVRLRDAAGDLGEELRPCDADGDRQADDLADVASEPQRDLGRCPGYPLEAAYVEERLIDRQALDKRRCLVEDPEDRLAGFGIRPHARRHDDGLRAEAQGLPAAHRGADAGGLRLVARRQHDP